jgi:hypothetical protein
VCVNHDVKENNTIFLLCRFKKIKWWDANCAFILELVQLQIKMALCNWQTSYWVTVAYILIEEKVRIFSWAMFCLILAIVTISLWKCYKALSWLK